MSRGLSSSSAIWETADVKNLPLREVLVVPPTFEWEGMADLACDYSPIWKQRAALFEE